jgi:flagellar basal body-associated protein FliL
MKKVVVICIVLFVVLIAGVAAVFLPMVARMKEAAERIAAEPVAIVALRELGSEIGKNDYRKDGDGNVLGIDLEHTQITEAGLVYLKEMTKLELLALPEQVTDAGLEHLKGLTNLKELHLNETQITDAGLVHLTGLKNLVSLGLHGTQITDAGIAELKKALPDCKISH